jgi:hypothetical protein
MASRVKVSEEGFHTEDPINTDKEVSGEAGVDRISLFT